MTNILSALSLLYRNITSLRNVCYDKSIFTTYKCKLKVISVGNITVGGTGKTPLCLWIARFLKSKNIRPVILSRGYGGSLSGPILVTNTHNSAQVGDEPLLMSKEFSIVVSKNRAAGARYIEQLHNYDLIIMDDGLQHRKLKRDLNIATVNVSSDKACREFTEGKLLPEGRFREDRSKALARCDVVIFNMRGPERQIDCSVAELIPKHCAKFTSYLEMKGIYSIATQQSIFPKSVIALTGIANPEGFYSLLEKNGIVITKKFAFPDHHKFTTKQIDEIRSANPNTWIVVTEKDMIRLSPSEWGHQFAALKVELVLKSPDKLQEIILNSSASSSNLS